MLVTDYSTIEQISARLIESSEELARMVESVAKARQIRDYDGDRRKRALSVAVADILRNRVVMRGKGAEVWGWGTAYGSKQAGQPAPVTK